jgi:hypothetical protein
VDKILLGGKITSFIMEKLGGVCPAIGPIMEKLGGVCPFLKGA